ncbi:DNA polymerase III subunit delta [Mariprofundus micogutta]|uniref:DNA-directed DNA polymerase n=1 Tax=Mariprofundus micogutta TaxID=1921010 RepID=A0A1L8CL00_9PROT|nr:DNA polymerase III subunit delta [Mariprofundus micogutta]GAV19565.1 DNA polymerase III subunit delta [Mariprofundus micogutta]
MRLRPNSLIPPEYNAYYLHGEDEDAIFEAAEALLAAGDKQAHRLRVDINELARIEEASRNQGLFGPSTCYALIRNAQSANPKQTDHLLRLSNAVLDDNRLIICAPGIDWKKALNKKMKAQSDVAECEFGKPDESSFARWLESEISKAGLDVKQDALLWMAESLCGMRLAARQMIERLSWYDNGRGAEIGADVVAELLGERAPGALDEWCHAVAMREARAVGLARHLLRNQQVAEVQMISWLGTRMQQLLMYRWFASQGDRNPLMAAKVFGDARSKVGAESKAWAGAELSLAVKRIVDAEKLIKGASVEDNITVIERLTLDLIEQGRLSV